MIIVDAHEDIAYNALCFGRDYRQPVRETRAREANTDIPGRAGVAMCGLPDALDAGIGLVFATVFVAPASRNPAPWDKLTYTDAKEAHKLASQQVDHYYRLTDMTDKIDLILTQADLDALLKVWEDGASPDERRQGFVLLMEGADPILEPKQFEEWHARGVRIVGLAWAGTRYAGGTGQPGPLTALGRELLDVLMDFNVVLDLSHSAEEAYFQALDRYEGVIIASHSNPRRFRNTDRHLTDVMIRRLAERDGVIGVLPYNAFLSDDWRKGDPKQNVPFNTVVDAIDYICQLTGSAAHVGIGSDFDGGFGADSAPEGIDTVADLRLLDKALHERGYSDDDVRAILGGNMLRKLRQSLPAK